jgi:hypothetical protein
MNNSDLWKYNREFRHIRLFNIDFEVKLTGLTSRKSNRNFVLSLTGKIPSLKTYNEEQFLSKSYLPGKELSKPDVLQKFVFRAIKELQVAIKKSIIDEKIEISKYKDTLIEKKRNIEILSETLKVYANGHNNTEHIEACKNILSQDLTGKVSDDVYEHTDTSIKKLNNIHIQSNSTRWASYNTPEKNAFKMEYDPSGDTFNLNLFLREFSPEKLEKIMEFAKGLV